MCRDSKNPNPNPNPQKGEDEERQQQQERDLRKQALVEELAVKLSNAADPSAQIEAAREIRKMARASASSRTAFAVAAVLDPLVSMLSSADREPKESALLALLNLAVRNERNKEIIAKSGATPLLIELLKSENDSLRERATAAVLTLSASTANRPIIAASGAIPLLVQILISGSIQARVDAVTALYNMSNCKDTPCLALSVDATRPLLNLLRDCKKHSKFAEKATALLEILSRSDEGMHSISETENGILTLVETVEEGSLQSTEQAVGILLSLCRSCRDRYRDMILKEGPIPGLLLLTVDGSQNAQFRARNLLELLRDNDSGKVKKMVAAEEELETIVYNIATKVDGPEKAEKTAKRILQDMVRRRMELNMTRIQSRAVSSGTQTRS